MFSDSVHTCGAFFVMHYPTIIFVRRAAFGFIDHFTRLFFDNTALLLLLDITNVFLDNMTVVLTLGHGETFFTHRIRRSDYFTR